MSLDELAGTINGLLDRTRGLPYTQVIRFTADASHELRRPRLGRWRAARRGSPLQRPRGQGGSTGMSSHRSASSASGFTALVNGLLLLARADRRGGPPQRGDPSTSRPLAGEVRRDVRNRLRRSAGFKLINRRPGPSDCHRGLLAACGNWLTNLLDKRHPVHGPPAVSVTLRVEEAGRPEPSSA